MAISYSDSNLGLLEDLQILDFISRFYILSFVKICFRFILLTFVFLDI